MKRLFTMLCLLGLLLPLQAQTTITFTNFAMDGDWNNALNWDLFRTPIAGDVAIINGSSSIAVLSTTVTVETVTVSGGGTLNVTATGVLNIVGSNTDHALEITGLTGTITNDGTINIDDTTGQNAILSKGVFDNDGTISIGASTAINGDGIYVQQGVFTNNGTITITNCSSDYIHVDDNSGDPATLSNVGSITITMTTGDDGIYVNDGSMFDNSGTINITASGGDMGMNVDDSGIFTNLAAGVLNISNTIDHGVYLDGNAGTATLTNAGTINITGVGGESDGIRIQEEGILNNNTGGVLNISFTGGQGIDMQINSTANNSGTINIFNTTKDGIEMTVATALFNNNSGGVLSFDNIIPEAMDMIGGVFNNNAGATYKATNITDDAIEINTATFNNAGTIETHAIGGESIETFAGFTFTSSGIINIGCPGTEKFEIKGDLDLGTSCIPFEINGLTAVSDHDQIENFTGSTITISGAIAKLEWGSYVPAVGDCFTIVAGSGDVTGEFASFTTSNSDIILDPVTYTGTNVKICVSSVCGIPSTNVALASSAITLSDAQSCTDANDWSYYGDGSGNYLFAIEWDAAGTGSNAAAKAAATVTINVDAAIGSAVSGTDGTWTMKRHWDVSGATLVDPVNVKFFYDAAEQAEIVTAQATHGGVSEGFTWFKTVGTAFDPAMINPNSVGQGAIALTDVSGGAMENGVLYAQFNGITSFSGGTGAIGSGPAPNPLPVELGYFLGEKTQKGIELSWSTMTEINNEGFDIQKSYDGKSWMNIGYVSGNGNSNRPIEYSYVDGSPESGLNYYRLKQVDFDGNFEFSNMVALDYEISKKEISLYPNPVDDVLFIDSQSSENIQVELFDVNGKLLMIERGAIQQLSFADIEAGIYFLKVISTANQSIHKIINN